MPRLLLLAALVFWAQPAQAWQGLIGKWNLSNSTRVGFRIDRNGSYRSNINDGSDYRAITDALDTWTAVSCATIAGQNIGDTQGSPRAARDGTNNVWFQTNAGAWPHGAGTLGITSTSFQGRGCNRGGSKPYAGCYIVDADVQFNEVNYPSNRGQWGTANRGRHIDIQSIAVHELGHALGLDHPCENCTVDAVMTPAYVGYPFRWLRQDDTNGICSIYPGQRGGLGWGCQDGSDCNSNLCIVDGNSRYCSQTCGSCPEGYECGANGGRNVCLRADALADAAGRGEACVGRPCQEGLVCLGSENDANCYQTCEQGDPPCPQGSLCRTIEGGGQRISLCMDGGDTGRGELCDSYYACTPGLECAPTPTGWRCSQSCSRDADCAESEECAEVTRPGVDTLDICVDRRTARLGESCQTKPCEEGTTCVYSNGERLCFRNCTSSAECSGGMECVQTRNGGVCAPYVGDNCGNDLDCPQGQVCEGGECRPFSADDAALGERCAEDSDCASEACGFFDGNGECARGCDQRLGHYQCPEGYGCLLDDVGNGTCVQGGDSGRGGVGDSCDNGNQCVNGICMEGQCTTWCGDDDWCPADTHCDDSAVEPGICAPGADSPTPGVQFPGGCSCGAGATFGLEWLLLMGLVRRRRRS